MIVSLFNPSAIFFTLFSSDCRKEGRRKEARGEVICTWLLASAVERGEQGEESCLCPHGQDGFSLICLTASGGLERKPLPWGWKTKAKGRVSGGVWGLIYLAGMTLLNMHF